VGEEKGKAKFGAMVANKPKRECGLCPSILGTFRKDKKKKCHQDPKTHRLHKDLKFTIIALVKPLWLGVFVAKKGFPEWSQYCMWQFRCVLNKT